MGNRASAVSADRLELPYRILSGDDSDERACSTIPDEACSEIPRNYLLNVVNGAATKLAEQLASPGLVLPWLLSSIGAPATLATLLTPVKQAGSLLPQLAVAAWIRSLARRKWAWVVAGSLQAGTLLLAVAAAIVLPPLPAGIGIVVCFLLFSALSGIGSVAFQDVLGKTIPKGRRGRLLANRATIGGCLTLAAAAALHFGLEEQARLSLTLALVLAAAGLWALGALAFAAIDETPGATSGGRSMLGELRAGLGLFRDVRGFRRFVMTRGLLLAVELAMPFYALHASRLLGDSAASLAILIFAVGLANIVSSPFWGALSDASSKSVMAISGAIGAAAGLGAVSIAFAPAAFQNAWLYAVLFFALGVAEAGARLGRKTYLADAAPDDERPLYVAFSNTVVGLLALIGGFLGLLVDLTAPLVAIVVLALISALAVLAAARLPEADGMIGTSRLSKAS